MSMFQGMPEASAARPVTWVVPFAPGGMSDLVARALAGPLGQRLGQPVVVENHPGGAGALGTELVLRRPADGHTLLNISTGPMAVNPALHRHLRYDPLRDLVPVHGLLQSSPLLAVDAASPWHTLADFLDAARHRPGELRVGSAAPGTSTCLAGVLLARESKTRWLQDPHPGATSALQDLLGGRLDAVVNYLLPLRPHLDSGRLRALAVLGRRRLALLPEVPTVAEVGLRGAEVASWSGIAVRAGTPEKAVRRLGAAVHQVLSDPEVMSAFIALGEIPLLELTEAPLRAFIAAEQARWGGIVRVAGVAVE
ncbi:tripartite tricarboxylate transporter substrate binding protein [Azohydromonas australica]|uniref:tripartite tricarboxylate transporter substrate binding protein n=1 Tax=Azohydromonas australica TaxID=364039 RepID=UPI000405798F|nr:tripartite tricarboxylate transporter substrate binding protein [Azohydromonas australica]